MTLHPIALAKTCAAIGLLLFLSNLGLTIAQVGMAPFRGLGTQLLIAMVVIPLVAAIVGYVAARLYNYFLPN